MKQVLRRTNKKDTEARMNTLELKTRKKIKVCNGVWMEVEIKDNLPLMSGEVGEKTQKFCKKVDAMEGFLRELVDKVGFTEVGKMMAD